MIFYSCSISIILINKINRNRNWMIFKYNGNMECILFEYQEFVSVHSKRDNMGCFLRERKKVMKRRSVLKASVLAMLSANVFFGGGSTEFGC